MNNILTWHAPSNNGAFQKMTEYGIFSDLYTAKPMFSFEYENLEYVETVGKYTVDGQSMTDEQKTEILAAIEAVVVPISFYINVRTAQYKHLLKETDWYVIRKMETGVDIPEEITNQRADARLQIDAVRAEYA